MRGCPITRPAPAGSGGAGRLVQDQKTQRQVAQINPRQPRKARPIAVRENFPGRRGEVMTPMPFVSRRQDAARRRMGAGCDDVEAFPQSLPDGDEPAAGLVGSWFDPENTLRPRRQGHQRLGLLRRQFGQDVTDKQGEGRACLSGRAVIFTRSGIHFQPWILPPRPPGGERHCRCRTIPNPQRRHRLGAEVIQKRAARDAAAAAPVEQLTPGGDQPRRVSSAST